MRAAIALGSNLASSFGDPAANLQEATHRLRAFGEVAAVSSFRETDPVGFTDQPRFTNAALLLTTHLGPLPLLRTLLEVEKSMGRDRRIDTSPKGPRIIDLDLLLYEVDGLEEHTHSLVLNDPDLVLPHPEMHRRAFVLEPLAEIAPDLVHPVLQQTISALLTSLVAHTN